MGLLGLVSVTGEEVGGELSRSEKSFDGVMNVEGCFTVSCRQDFWCNLNDGSESNEAQHWAHFFDIFTAEALEQRVWWILSEVGVANSSPHPPQACLCGGVSSSLSSSESLSSKSKSSSEGFCGVPLGLFLGEGWGIDSGFD